MTQFEQVIYNKYLAISRLMLKKPFKLRKDFKGFENTKNYLYVQKLANLFNRNPEIDLQLFFEAPFKIYKDESYFDLKFYNSRKALKVYRIAVDNLRK